MVKTQYNIQKSSENFNESTNTLYIGILAILTIALTIFTILKFTNRLLQIKLSLLCTLLLSALVGLMFIAIRTGNKMLTSPEEGSFKIGFYLPIACILLTLLATRFIRKDEELVRSVDRLR